MNVKKLLAVLCACALFFALAVPAFAASSTAVTNSASIDLDGTYAPDDDLEVAVSVLYAMKKLYVNPYSLPYSIKNTTLTTDGTTASEDGESIKEETTTDGWFSNTAVIKNNSTGALHVSVTITTEAQGAARVVASKADAAHYPQYNCLYGNFQITTASLVSGVITPSDWDATATGNMKEVPIPDTANPNTAAQDTQFILAGGQEGTGVNAGTIVPTYAAFRIRGGAVICAQDATGSDATLGSIANVWDQGDVVHMKIAFSFGE